MTEPDKQNILLYIEDKIEDIANEQGLTDEERIEMLTPVMLMKRDQSEQSLEENSIVLQNIVDKLVNEIGLTSNLMILQAHIQQLRVLFDIRDTFN